MLYLVGLGLSPGHLSREAIEVLRSADVVFLDTYTSVVDEETLRDYESTVGRGFRRASRRDLEDGMARIVEEAAERNVAVAVPGDPLVATTHVAMLQEAMERGVKVRYIPGISVYSVVPSLAGLQHYKFGRTVTVPYGWKQAPSFYEHVERNKREGLHTLVLLDLHPEPLTIPDALQAFLYWEKKKKRGVLELGDLVVGVARAGSRDCLRFVGTVEELLDVEWGRPPHALVIPGNLHPVEEEVLYAIRRYGDVRCEG